MNRCHFCGGELVEQLTTFLYEENDQVCIVRNVPAFVCKQCGEKEYAQETTHRILTFLKHPTRPADILHVPTYDLAAVA
jgi:YgiT-type zinc finger domain-containing protein